MDSKGTLDTSYPDDLGPGGRWQMRIQAYTDALLETARAHPSFSWSAIDDEARTFVVYGTGSPDLDVVAAMQAAPSSVTVSWQSVPCNEAELDAAASSAVELPGVLWSSKPSKLNGITVGVDGEAWADLDATRRRIEEQLATRVHVTFVDGTSRVDGPFIWFSPDGMRLHMRLL